MEIINKYPYELYGIINKVNNKIYNCIKEAELDMNISSKHIGQVANKKYGRKTAGGYSWVWA